MVEAYFVTSAESSKPLGLSPRQVAEFAGARPNTLYDLPHVVAGGSVRTLLVLARGAFTTVVLVPRRQHERDQ